MSVGIRVDGDGSGAGLRVIAADIAKIPVELRRRAAPRLRAAGETTRARAAANAAWSTRIPGALSLRVSTTGSRAGVTITADTSAAPHARVYEGMVADTFRHPVFGNREHWVSQASRPYLRPAVRATGAQVVNDIASLLDDVLGATGWR